MRLHSEIKTWHIAELTQNDLIMFALSSLLLAFAQQPLFFLLYCCCFDSLKTAVVQLHVACHLDRSLFRLVAYDGPELFDNQNYVTTKIRVHQVTTDETKTENTDSEDNIQTIQMGTK